MAKKYNWYTKDDVLTHLKSEHQRSLNFVTTKRDLFRERLKDYTNVTQDKDKIYVRLIFSVMQTLMALHYQDEMTVEFIGRQLGANEVAEQLENLASFDYDEMNMEKLMFSVERDRLFFGTGILVFDHRDNTKLHPVYKRINPLSWLPDPSGNSNFHQFELELNSSFITKENGFMNTKKVQDLISKRNSETDETMQKYAETRELQYSTPTAHWKWGYMIPVHYCYTELGWDKYYIVTACDHWVIIKMEKIEAVFAEEKKDKSNIEYPVFTFQYSPMEGDPFGISIPDLISDKQRAMQLFLNLERIKAENEARWDMFVVDTTKVNIKDLKQVSRWPKYIKSKGGELKNYIMEVPKSQIKWDVSYMKNALQQQSTLDIGLDERSLGITPDRNITATENQRVQKNANIRQMLNTRVKMRGIKSFWNDWYKRYYANFNYSSVKNVIINSRLGSRPITVRKKDIITGYDINIAIISKAEREAEREKQKVDFFATLNLILDDPQASIISKTLAKRKAMKLSGMTSEEARLYVAPSLEEMQAQYDIEMINKNELPEIWEASEDHQTYIVLYQRALPTPARFASIEARKQLYLQSWQQQAQQMAADQQQIQPWWWMGWWAMAQLANWAMQQNEQVATALQ